MGEEKLGPLLQESLATAARSGAAKPADFTKVIIDTTVQPKAVCFPTDAKLMQRALHRLGRLAKKHGIKLRPSYPRAGKFALTASRFSASFAMSATRATMRRKPIASRSIPPARSAG